MEVDLHGCWRAPRNVFEMDKGLKDILKNWDSYFRNQCFETAQTIYHG